MLTLKTCAVILSLTSSITIAAPVNDVSPNPLAKRVEPTSGPGSKGQPKNLQISIDGWRDLAEINCYIMLCILGTDIFQRGPNSAYGEQEYRKAGAKNQPFHDDGIQKYGTTRASKDTISPEDFPWRSIRVPDGQQRYLTAGPFPQQSVQGGCIEAAYEGKQGGDVIGFDEWFEINLLKEQAPFGPMCTAWLAKDYTVCGTDKKLDVLGQVGIVLASLVYYYAAGTYYHATQKGRKRSLDSVKWDVDPNTLEWPEIPADAEEVKRAIVVLDEAGNELARTETRSIVELDEAGNVPSGDKVKAKAFKRGAVELDGAGNVLSMDKLRRAVLELDVDGNELFGSKE